MGEMVRYRSYSGKDEGSGVLGDVLALWYSDFGVPSWLGRDVESVFVRQSDGDAGLNGGCSTRPGNSGGVIQKFDFIFTLGQLRFLKSNSSWGTGFWKDSVSAGVVFLSAEAAGFVVFVV